MSSPQRIWRGSTLDARSSERRDQLVEAAVELLGTEGAPGLTMRAVCRIARLSPRYFYESFTDRDELMLAAFDTTVERMRAEVENALASTPDPNTQLRAAFDAAAALIETDRRVGRILFREPFADDKLRPHAVAALPEFFLGTLGQLPNGAALLAGTDEHRLALQISALSGALVSLFLDWTDGRLTQDRDHFVDYCTDFARSMLAQTTAR